MPSATGRRRCRGGQSTPRAKAGHSGGGRSIVMAAALIAGMGAGASVGTQVASAQTAWSVSTSFPPAGQYITGVSCAAATRPSKCEAVGYSATGAVALSSTDGGATWAAQIPPVQATQLSAVSCPSATFCIAAGDEYQPSGEYGAFAITADGGATWTYEEARSGVMALYGVSCPSSEICEAVGANEQGDPIVAGTTDGGADWSIQHIPPGALELSGISCSSIMDCEAVGEKAPRQGLILGTSNGGALWSVQTSPAAVSGYSGVDCVASTTFCVAVGIFYPKPYYPRFKSITYPIAVASSTTNAGTSWSADSLPQVVSELGAVSCWTASACEATGDSSLDAGLALGTSNGGASWSDQTLPGEVSGLPAVSCFSQVDCVAGGFTYGTSYSASLLTTTDMGTAWSAAALPDGVPELFATSCSSSTSCVAVGYTTPASAIIESSANGGTSWAAEGVPPGVDFLYGVDCPDTLDCVAVGQSQAGAAIVVSTDGGETWTSESPPAGAYVLSAIFCTPGAEDCDAVGYITPPTGPASGVVVTTTDGGENWSMASVPAATPSLYAVSCWLGVTDCVAVGGGGGQPAVLATTDGTSWASQPLPAGATSLRAISCPAARDCFAAGYSLATAYAGAVFATTNGGATWSGEQVPADVSQLAGISCTSATTCVAVGTSSSGASSVIATDDGTDWADQSVPSGAGALSGVSCAPGGAGPCVASGTSPSGGANLLNYDPPEAPPSSAPSNSLPALLSRPTSTRSAAAAGAPDAEGFAGPGDWPAFLLGGAHSSYNLTATAITINNVAQLKVAWQWQSPPSQTSAPDDFLATPIVSGGNIYIGSNDGYMFAVNETTHETVWSDFLGVQFATRNCNTASQGLTSSATVAPDPATGQPTVFVDAANGYLYAIDAATGAIVWKAIVDVPSIVHNDYYAWGSPLVANGRVYIGISSVLDCPLVPAGLVSFDQSTGAQLAYWDSLPAGQIGASIWSSAAVAPDGDIIASTGNGPANVQNLYAESVVSLDPDSLQLLGGWQVPVTQQKIDDDFGASPTIFTADIDGSETTMVGVCNKNGLYYAFQENDLTAGPVWTYRMSPSVVGGVECDAAAIWNGTELIEGGGGSTTINGTEYEGSVQALNPATGAPIWETGLSGEVVGSPAEDGAGVVSAPIWFSPTDQWGVALLNASTGAELSFVNTQQGVFGQGVFANNDLVIGAGPSVLDYRVGGSGP